jgi:hypothetical protein
MNATTTGDRGHPQELQQFNHQLRAARVLWQKKVHTVLVLCIWKKADASGFQ